MKNKTRTERLEDALAATLLFHSAEPWDRANRLLWFNLTQRPEATTKGLCDFIRETLEGPKGEDEHDQTD